MLSFRFALYLVCKVVFSPVWSDRPFDVQGCWRENTGIWKDVECNEMRLCRSLFFQIVLATVLGVLSGLVAPDIAVMLKPLSDLFLRLISMLV
ncbi:cation:dicarboxylate symporter family transporter [Komagataeibacter melomenusus]|uniref:cation:dicarboxylate symporter family transporter n=1 Tax=Komagataeibacter melomenusus TaxID=2766578 RepID=UPI0034D3761D